MNVQPKGKNIHNQQQQQQQQPAGPPSYQNQQQSRPNAPFHPNYDDGSPKYPYAAYVSGVGGAASTPQGPPRLPLVPGIPGPNPPIPGAPNSAVGGMPQGPPPGSFGHAALDMSKQTPPHQHHQGVHHPIPPGPLGVNQPLAMAGAGHTGPMQGRPTQGNNQFYNRAPLRPNNMTRPPMGSNAPTHPPNPAPVMPYPGQPLSQPVVVFINDQYNQQPQLFQNPYQYYQTPGNMPPGSVYQPRAAQQPYANYRPATPFAAPYIPSSPAVYYSQQQQQTHQPAAQQSQQPAAPQQAPQPVPMGPVSVPGIPPTSQSRESTGGSRRPRSSAIRIVDPNTNRDVFTGEEVPPPVVPVTTATPPTTTTTATAPSESAAVAAAAVATPAATVPVVAAQVVEEAESSQKPAAEPEPEKVAAPTAKVEVKTEPVAAAAAAAAPAAPAAAIEPVAPPAAAISEPAKKAEPAQQQQSEQTPAEKQAQANGEVPATSEPSSTSTPPVSSSTSPDSAEAGRGNQKGGGKRRKNSRTGSTPTPTSPPPPHSIEEARVPAAPSAASTSTTATTTTPATPVATSSSEVRAVSQEKDAAAAPVAVPPTPAPVSEPEPPSKAETEVKETPAASSTVESAPAEEKPAADKPSAEVSIESVITNGDKQATSEQPSPSGAGESAATPTLADDGDAAKSAKPALRYSYKDDQWSPVNPEGKKAYDRTFLLELQNNPASQKKPDGLPNLEVVRDKNAAMKRTIAPGDVFTPPFVKIMPPKGGLPKRNSQQGNRGDQGMGGMQQQAPRREIKLMTSIARQERVEDPNVWKPKHAAKGKEDDPTKMHTDELLKTVRGILNKLTPSKFDKLLNKIQALNIDTEERLAGVIKLFFEKAVDEPIFSSTYAKMCQAMSTKEVSSAANPAETTNFRKLLLTRCQKEFEKDSAGLQDVEKKRKEIEASDNEDKKKLLEEELEDLVNKNRRRSLGNIRFIGELFKLRILSVKIMHQCIGRLLSAHDDEESLECLCRLLSTIGKELETPMAQTAGRSTSISQTKEVMNGYFSQLDGIIHKRKVSNRIRFMIQDVIDLRRNNWKPRREDNNPKTIDQIHKDVAKEREEQERELNNPQFQGPMGSLSGQRDNRLGDRRGDRGDDRNRKGSRPGDDGWSMVNNPRGGTNKVDIKQLKIPKAPGDSDQGISLGPGGKGMTMWGRGASGGMSQSLMGNAPSQESRGSNRYQLLEDSDSGMHEPAKAPFSGRSSLGGQPPRSQDYRTMPGATKSAFFPPNGERDRSVDPRSQPSGLGGGRSRSQQSSRESSVTRPARDAPPPLQRAVSKEMLQGKPSATEDEIERKVKSILGELFTNESLENAVLDLKEWLHPSTVEQFINQCVMFVLEHNRTERRATGTLFKEMIKRRLFNSNDIANGFNEVLQCAEDFIVDIPMLWEYLAEMVEPVFEDGVVNFNFLGQLSSPLGSYATKFVAAILRELVKAQGGAAGAERIWTMSNVSLASVLPPGVELNAFVSQNRDLDFLVKAPSSPYLDFQRSLQDYLKKSSQLTNDDVCKWVDSQQHVDRHSPAFIRALVTAVTESSIDGHGTESKLIPNTFKEWTEVLRRYVENLPDRELQLLFAVQALVTQRQHPKGLIQGIFEALYDSNVVSEEGFESWVASDDPAEREGKAVAMKSITSFLTWLKEADAESDQEADV